MKNKNKNPEYPEFFLIPSWENNILYTSVPSLKTEDD